MHELNVSLISLFIRTGKMVVSGTHSQAIAMAEMFIVVRSVMHPVASRPHTT